MLSRTTDEKAPRKWKGNIFIWEIAGRKAKETFDIRNQKHADGTGWGQGTNGEDCK